MHINLKLQMKVLSVELARKYMKRILNEVNALSGPHKEPNREFLLLQGVRFASRVHQVTFTFYFYFFTYTAGEFDNYFVFRFFYF